MSDNLVRTRLSIMQELQALTDQMLEQKDDADALASGVELRQALMEEFDTLPAEDVSDRHRVQIRLIATQILQKDKDLERYIKGLRDEAKQDLSKNAAQQKLMGYATQGMSSSGSYMDYRK